MDSCLGFTFLPQQIHFDKCLTNINLFPVNPPVALFVKTQICHTKPSHKLQSGKKEPFYTFYELGTTPMTEALKEEIVWLKIM